MRTVGQIANGRWEVVETKGDEFIAVHFFDDENRARAWKRCCDLEDAGVPMEDAVARAKREYPCKVVAALLAVLFACAPALAVDKYARSCREQDKEVAKAEKRAKRAINWAFEHRDRPMPPCDLKGKDCEK